MFRTGRSQLLTLVNIGGCLMTLQALLRGAVVGAACALTFAHAQAQTPPMAPDIPAQFERPTATFDYIKRVEMIPMRDGVKLYTVMIIPKGAKDAPILLTRTPYNAKRSAERFLSPYAVASGAQMDEPFLADGYLRVYQDVRGKYGSEGDYVARSEEHTSALQSREEI